MPSLAPALTTGLVSLETDDIRQQALSCETVHGGAEPASATVDASRATAFCDGISLPL